MGYQIRLPAGAEGSQAAAFRQLAGEVSFALGDLERRLTAAGVLKEGAVAGEQLAAGAVTADKLAEGAVTADKLAQGAVTEETLADGAVTADKLGPSALERIDQAAGAVEEALELRKSNKLTVEPVVLDNISVNLYTSNLTLDAARPGCTPVGIVGWQLNNATSSGARASWVFLYQLRLSGTNVLASLRCTHDSGAVVKLTVYVLYVQD